MTQSPIDGLLWERMGVAWTLAAGAAFAAAALGMLAAARRAGRRAARGVRGARQPMIVRPQRARRPLCEPIPTMKRRLPILVVVAFVGLVAGCATLPPPTDRMPSQALTDTAQTRLGQAVAPRLAEHPGLSGFMPFEDPHDAFAARVLLARAAERSLDVQYFIWHGDAVGAGMGNSNPLFCPA